MSGRGVVHGSALQPRVALTLLDQERGRQRDELGPGRGKAQPVRSWRVPDAGAAGLSAPPPAPAVHPQAGSGTCQRHPRARGAEGLEGCQVTPSRHQLRGEACTAWASPENRFRPWL